jgi:hypothetical protein
LRAALRSAAVRLASRSSRVTKCESAAVGMP